MEIYPLRNIKVKCLHWMDIFSTKKCKKWTKHEKLKRLVNENPKYKVNKHFGLINHNKNSCTFGKYWNANFTVYRALHVI